MTETKQKNRNNSWIPDDSNFSEFRNNIDLSNPQHLKRIHKAQGLDDIDYQ